MNRNVWLTNVVKPHLGTTHTAVEIGVWRGDYSDSIVRALNPEQFYGVDPYELFEGMVSAPGSEYINQNRLDQLAERVQNKYAQWGATLLRQTSESASTQFADGSVDFVYIDGDHTREGVTTDINCWWPKVRAGGILSGDDHTPGTTGKGYAFGVIEAVADFAKQHNLTVSVTSGANPSWWVIK